MDRLKLLKEIDQLDFMIEWQAANPKTIPFKELRTHIRESIAGDDPIENKYRARIKNRATAIRAMCVVCQGGDVYTIKECSSITCPLYPFRMGKDPLRGWQLPKHTAIELPDDDEDGPDLFEDGDDDEGDSNVQ